MSAKRHMATLSFPAPLPIFSTFAPSSELMEQIGDGGNPRGLPLHIDSASPHAVK